MQLKMKKLVALAAVLSAFAGEAAFDPLDYVRDELTKGAKRIVVPKGIYKVNTETNVYLQLTGLKDVEIDFSGSELQGTFRTRMIGLADCERTTIKNLTIDYPWDLPFGEGVIKEVSGDGDWIIETFEGYPVKPAIEIKWPLQVYAHDDDTRLVNPMRYGNGFKIEKTGERTYRVTGGVNRRGEVGDYAVWALYERKRPTEGSAIAASRCSALRVENVTVFSSPRGASFAESAGVRGSTWINCRLDRRPPETDPVRRAYKRLRSGNHDAFNSRYCQEGPTLEGCTLRYHCDDGVNISGYYAIVSAFDGKTADVIVYRGHEDEFAPGEPVQFMLADGTVPDESRLATAEKVGEISKAERDLVIAMHVLPGVVGDLQWAYRMTFEKVPEGFGRGSLVFPLRHGGNGFTIRNCRLGPNRARGLMLNASEGLVEGCTMDRTEAEGTRVASSYPWMEGGCTRDLVFRNNTYIGTRIYIGANLGPGRMLPAKSHKNITIENNTFREIGLGAVIQGCTGLKIRGNTVVGAPPGKGFELVNCEDVENDDASVRQVDPLKACYALYLPRKDMKDVKTCYGPRMGAVDSTNPKDIAAEIDLAANASIDVFVFDAPLDALAQETVEKGFLAAKRGGAMLVALRWLSDERPALPKAVTGAPEYLTLHGRPVVLTDTAARAEMLERAGYAPVTPKTLALGAEPDDFEARLRSAVAGGPVLLDAWNRFGATPCLVPDYIAGDAFLRSVAAVRGRHPKGTYVFAQAGKRVTHLCPEATHENVAYGPHYKQKLDVWLPENGEKPVPCVVYFHGGAWKVGEIVDPGVPQNIEEYRKKGIAFVAVGYRFLFDASGAKIHPPVKACIDDAFAAVKFVQSKAEEWGIDPKRLHLAGGSAGACSVLNVALRDNNALGVFSVGASIAQTTLDPKLMREIIPNISYGHNAFGFAKFEHFLAKRDEVLPLVRQYSPIDLVATLDPKRAPKLFLSYQDQPTPGKDAKDAVHAPAFGVIFEEACRKRGIPCEITYGKAAKDRKTSIAELLLAK